MATKISGYIRDEILTFTGLKKRGFFVPYKYAATVPKTIETYAEIEAHFEKTGNETQQFIRAIAANISRFRLWMARLHTRQFNCTNRNES